MAPISGNYWNNEIINAEAEQLRSDLAALEERSKSDLEKLREELTDAHAATFHESIVAMQAEFLGAVKSVEESLNQKFTIQLQELRMSLEHHEAPASNVSVLLFFLRLC